MSEAEIDEKLFQSITIFKYIDEKDVFQNIYQTYLAKRLIHQQSLSTVAEEGMINNLKVNQSNVLSMYYVNYNFYF